MTDRFHAVPMATWARRYIDTFKLALVAIEPGEKAPKGLGWNKPGGYITDAQAAEAFWSANPTHSSRPGHPRRIFPRPHLRIPAGRANPFPPLRLLHLRGAGGVIGRRTEFFSASL